MTLEYQFGEDIADRQRFHEILNEWNPHVPTYEQFELELRNAQDGIAAVLVDGMPGFLLRTVLLPISDVSDLAYIGDIDALTGNQTWSTYDSKGKTRVMVDFTNSEGMRGRHLAHPILGELLKIYWDRSEHIETTTPVAAEELHRRHNAEARLGLINFRPNYPKSRNAIVMVYK